MDYLLHHPWLLVIGIVLAMISGAIAGTIAKKLRRPPPCSHPRATERRWLDPDGTPMIDWRCPDCGEHEHGHVYADAENWAEDGG